MCEGQVGRHGTVLENLPLPCGICDVKKMFIQARVLAPVWVVPEGYLQSQESKDGTRMKGKEMA